MTVTASRAAVTVAGTFNGWDPTAAAAERIDAGRFETRCRLARGRHSFKFVVDGRWARCLGGRGSEPLVPPTAGRAMTDGADIVLNVLEEAEYRILLDRMNRTWTVQPTQPLTGLAGALYPPRLIEGGFGDVVRALREDGDGKRFGYSWERWERLRPFLEQGAQQGFFPIRDGHRVLFVAHADYPGPLFLAGSMNGWSVGSDRFERLPGSDLHLLYRELDPDPVHLYKLVCERSWFSDSLNRWVAPDRQPVPPLQPGAFNSLLDLAMPACERGDPLLHVRFPSVVRAHERDVFISLPHGYTWDPERRYPVLYVQDGNEAVTRAFMHEAGRRSYESAGSLPCILVFVALADQMDRNWEYGSLEGRGAYAEFLVRELVPFIDTVFRTVARPAGRGVAGASFGGAIAYYAGWRHPETFGKVAGQGTSFYLNDWEILDLYAESPRPELQLYMDSARASARGRPRDVDFTARYAERILRGAGHAVRHVRRVDRRHDWSSWQDRFPEILHSFWPGPGA